MRTFQMRIEYLDGEEECNTFYTQVEAETAYNDRLASEQTPCDMELIEVLQQHRIK